MSIHVTILSLIFFPRICCVYLENHNISFFSISIVLNWYNLLKRNNTFINVINGSDGHEAFQVVLVAKNVPANAGDMKDRCSIPELGRFLGGGHGNPLQCSCLENPMDRRAWWSTVHKVAKSRTQLKWLSKPHMMATWFLDSSQVFITELKDILSFSFYWVG